jgi:putative ABC transport system permease protein
MKKVWNQVVFNLKKDRSSYISFGIIILITALILNCAAVLLLQVDPAYDTKFIQLNTADVNILVPEGQHSASVEAALG